MTNQKISNPFSTVSTLKNRALPFNLFQEEHYMPAIKLGIENAKNNISFITENKEPATFENTILKLETASDELDYVTTVLFNLNSANTNDSLQKIVTEASPILANYSSDVLLNPTLFSRIQTLFDQKDQLDLSIEQQTLLEKTFSSFKRNGALLSKEKKEELRALDTEISQCSPKFSENILKSTNTFQMFITDKSELAGLPDSAMEAAKAAASEKGEENSWLFTLDFPSYLALVTYADNRALREKIHRAMRSRAFNDEYDNQELTLKISQLRYKRAKILGYNTHAEFVLEKRMAESPKKVHAFLDKIANASITAAKSDITELQEFALTIEGPTSLQSWDMSYYSEKLKEHKFKFNEEEVRPYFQLENVVQGAFEHARRLYNIEFRKNDNYPTYHEDVVAYDVFEENSDKFIGIFYADFFPRASKRGGAWMSNFYQQGLFFGEVMRPHVMIVCNFTKPTPTKPSLLTPNEVRTLFHEFGHALHGLLSQCQYRSLSGTSVYWDFVELPSQVMENWTLESESLALFAKHYETGEIIPEELTSRLKESSLFQAGYQSLRQVSLGKLDLAWHDTDPTKIKEVSEYENKAIEPYTILPHTDGTNTSCSFGHIFAGGYSAGYYSYKWAEVLDADTFELFKEKGLFNQEAARSFKENILEKGGSEHPMELYKRFRGREPDPEALLRRDKLI